MNELNFELFQVPLRNEDYGWETDWRVCRIYQTLMMKMKKRGERNLNPLFLLKTNFALSNQIPLSLLCHNFPCPFLIFSIDNNFNIFINII